MTDFGRMATKIKSDGIDFFDFRESDKKNSKMSLFCCNEYMNAAAWLTMTMTLFETMNDNGYEDEKEAQERTNS